MNTPILKRFACEARNKLRKLVYSRIKWVLEGDSAELRGKERQIAQLKHQLETEGEDQVIESVAYTWFNRLIALRFMDANGYNTPCVLTPAEGMTNPEILQEALSGTIDAELKVDRERIADLLDGRVPAENPHQEVYRLLLVATCNHWNARMPFLFEHIADYTELLLPDDLLSPASILTLVREEMRAEDCTEEEIIGWLYQFYISEENARLIKSKSKYKKEELAPASQLFTPKWIVRYMVENTLGQLWMEMHPESELYKKMPFYIRPDESVTMQPREQKSVEGIRFYDPCMGSGHILAYAYDLFYEMYEESGYSSSEIPALILKNNLWGTDIDPRAAQLAAFVLMMKARRSYRRYFRNGGIPNVTFLQDFEEDEKFANASALGSLIRVLPEEYAGPTVSCDELFGEQQAKLALQYHILGQRYDCVVTNPPYISSSRLEEDVKKYIETYYPATKSDLFATFILRCLELCREDGFTGYMTPFVWMFISSYEGLRCELIDKHFINSLVQLEYSGFDGATVPICTFTLRNNFIAGGKGSYVRLSDFKGAAQQAPKTLEAIAHPDCGWFYLANQKNFEKLPNLKIGYWLSMPIINTFNNLSHLNKFYPPKAGLSTGDNKRFLRFWYEVSNLKTFFEGKNREDLKTFTQKWVPMTKGGTFRRWYGNNEYLLNFENDGYELKKWLVNNPNDPTTKSYSRYIRNYESYCKEGISFSDVSSGVPHFRIQNSGFIPNSRGPFIFSDNLSLLGYLNSKLSKILLSVLSPTLTFNVGDIAALPYVDTRNKYIDLLVSNNISISKQDWDSHETSWDFQQNELIRQNKPSLSEAWEAYQNHWSEQFYTLHQNEEELNRQFIEIYGLEGELTPDVPLEEITILQQGEIKIEEGTLRFQPKAVIEQLVSYGVGCILGRYSFDKPGLILANQGETLEDYLAQVPEPTFMPDADNIVPVLEKEYFADDLVGEFKRFIGRAFGEEQLHDNLRFIEEALNMDLRKYFNKNFYTDHIKRYKKRPIYWMFASPKGYFKVLCYVHRMRPDTPSKIASDYLQPYLAKLEGEAESLRRESIRADLTPRDRNRIAKELDELAKAIKDCRAYEKTLLEFASTRTTMDLDDGVRVNYTKFKTVLVPIKGLEKEE